MADLRHLRGSWTEVHPEAHSATRSWWDDYRRGRYVKDREAASFARHFRVRAMTAAGEISTTSVPGQSRELVLKNISWGKSIGHAFRLIEYLSRDGAFNVTDPNDPNMINGVQAHHRVKEEWGLLPDAQNLKPEFQDKPSSYWLQVPEKDRLQSRQFLHSVVSLPKSLDIPDRSPLSSGQPDAAAAGFALSSAARSVFTDAGHDFLMFPHRDKGHLHFHFIIQAKSRTTGRQLHLQRSQTQALRQEFAQSLRRVGIDVIATERRDRVPELTQSPIDKAIHQTIQRGDASWFQRQQALQEGKHQLGTFARKAPGWHASFGLEYEKRVAFDPLQKGTAGPSPQSPAQRGSAARRLAERLGLAARSQPQEPAAAPLSSFLKDLPPEGADHLAKKAIGLYRAPEKALRSFAAMYQENPKMAVWALNRRPLAFGDLKAGWEAPNLTRRELNPAPAWFEAVKEALPAFNTLSATEKQIAQVQAAEATEQRQNNLATRAAERLQLRHNAASAHLLGLAERVREEWGRDPRAAGYAAQIEARAVGLPDDTPDLNRMIAAARAALRHEAEQASRTPDANRAIQARLAQDRPNDKDRER